MGKTVSCELIGLDEAMKRLEDLGARSDELLSRALYDGAKVMADGLKDAIRALPEDTGFKRIDRGDKPRNVVDPLDKEDLISHMGISSFRSETGKVYARISFDGYGQVRTKKFPNGRPVVLIARSINSGSSVRMKHPFIKPTVNQYKSAAFDAMRKCVEDELKKNGGQ